jgi:protocatechuate 3,4-dioxygenase beta subunit
VAIPRLAHAAAAADAPASADGNTALDLLVADAAGKAVGGAAVTVNIDGQNSKMSTGTDGHVHIPIPQPPKTFLSALVHANGFVDKLAEWRTPRTDPVPAAYTLTMEPAVRISGHVVDDAGQAVVGAHVELWVSKRFDNPHERLYRTGAITTDKDGIWSFDGAPTDGAAINVGAWDYRFANGEFYQMNQLTSAEAKDGSSKITLTRGVPVEGTVLKPDGTPLSGARVATGGEMASNRIPPQKTDKTGKFAYAAKPGEQVVLTVTAKGYATELVQFTMGSEKHEVSIPMVVSKPIVGRVVDADGKPVPNAWIFPDTWRGFRSLEVRAKADRNGKFVWNDPPIDTVLCDVDATGSGFIRKQNVPMSVSDQEIVVTVDRALRVTGTVVDAETNQPIPTFKIIHGIWFSKEQPITWERQQQIDPGHDGKFDFDQHWTYPGYAVRIEADGYAPAESRVFTADEKQVKLELKMKKAQAMSAVVIGADNKPLSGATVLLLEPGNNMQITNGRDTYNRESPKATSDADGHVSFPPPSGSLFKFVALHDSGYAEVESKDLSQAHEIHLTAWAKINGTLMIGSKPGAHQKVTAQVADDGRSPDDQKLPRVYHNMETTTAADGTFAFDRVPSGKIWVGRQVEMKIGRSRGWTMAQTQKVDAAAGQTLNVTIGGKGQAVVGRVVLPEALKTRSDWGWQWGTMARTKMPDAMPEMPDDIKKASGARQQEWWTNFMASDEGKAYQQRLRAAQETVRQYPLVVGADNSFTIDDVEPGTYQLSLSIGSANNDRSGGFGEELATGSADFTVPELPGGRSDTPLTLPDVQMTMLPRVETGQASPDFSVQTSEGKELKLSSLRGKFVLIDFFFPNMNNAGAIGAKEVKSATEPFASDDRFTMIGVNVSGSIDDAKSFTKDSEMTWTPTVPIGNLTHDLGLHSYPSIWLIGPDGKVLARDLRTSDAIKAALTTALGPQGL